MGVLTCVAFPFIHGDADTSFIVLLARGTEQVKSHDMVNEYKHTHTHTHFSSGIYT